MLSCDKIHPKGRRLSGRVSGKLSRLFQLFVLTCLTNGGGKQPIRNRTASSVMTRLEDDVSASFGWCGAHSSALLRRLWLHRAAQTRIHRHTHWHDEVGASSILLSRPPANITALHIYVGSNQITADAQSEKSASLIGKYDVSHSCPVFGRVQDFSSRLDANFSSCPANRPFSPVFTSHCC